MAIIVSFCFPQFVPVSAFSMLMVFFALSRDLLMCSPKVSLGSKVTPSIFGFLIVGIVVLFIESFKVVSYSAGSGVNNVEVDLSALSKRSCCPFE